MVASVKKLLLLMIAFALLPLTHPAVAQDAPIVPVEIKIMSFNVWRGGELVDFAKVIEAIEAADADIVGLQEAEGNTRRIAQSLGWEHANERTQIISRFPIIDPPAANGRYVYVQIRPGQVIAVINVHLPSDPYGPYDVQDGATLEDVLVLENETRVAAIQPFLDEVPALLEAGIPVLLTGDFNTPSHRDWTEPVADVRDDVLYPLAWPVTVAVEAVGFQDTYRAIYPDPVANPGITWTYGYPYPRLAEGEVVDRIDLVFAAGDVQILDSQVVGEGPDADIEVIPYPSDHRAVVSTVEITPAVPPAFVAAQQRRVEIGDTVVVSYHAPNGEGIDSIAIVQGDSDPSMWLPPYEASFFGTVMFGTGGLSAGEYAAVLLDGDSNELSRSNFWVVEPGATPQLSTSQAIYATGEPITITWENALGYRWDWIAIYSAGDPDLYNNYWTYAYINATVNGSFTFDADWLGDEMLPAGDYEARLLLDDGYAVLATVAFSITG